MIIRHGSRIVSALFSAALMLIFAVSVSCQENESAQQEETQETASTTKADTEKPDVDANGLTISSTAFEHEGMIPSKYTCDSLDVSPPLQISGVPEKTRSLVLIVDDPDAPNKTWVHWVLYNLPPDTESLPENFPTDAELESGARQGVTDFGSTGYGGPCPPSGTHRYFFKLYALDTMLDIEGEGTKAEVTEAMKGHILAQAQLMGKYSCQ
jgi:hypothetical protein